MSQQPSGLGSMTECSDAELLQSCFTFVGREDTRSLDLVPDDELLRRLVEILRQSRRVEADLVAHVGEVDARRLCAREASPSMFACCTQTLHLSEAEAYLRIAAARAAKGSSSITDPPVHLTGCSGHRQAVPHRAGENR